MRSATHQLRCAAAASFAIPLRPSHFPLFPASPHLLPCPRSTTSPRASTRRATRSATPSPPSPSPAAASAVRPLAGAGQDLGSRIDTAWQLVPAVRTAASMGLLSLFTPPTAPLQPSCPRRINFQPASAGLLYQAMLHFPHPLIPPQPSSPRRTTSSSRGSASAPGPPTARTASWPAWPTCCWTRAARR